MDALLYLNFTQWSFKKSICSKDILFIFFKIWCLSVQPQSPRAISVRGIHYRSTRPRYQRGTSSTSAARSVWPSSRLETVTRSLTKTKKKNIQVYKNELLFDIDLKYSSFFWSYVLWFMFLFLFLRTLLFKQPQTDSHLSPPLTTPFSWNATTAEEPSVWNLRLWNGRWDHLFCWRKLLKFISNLTN